MTTSSSQTVKRVINRNTGRYRKPDPLWDRRREVITDMAHYSRPVSISQAMDYLKCGRDAIRARIASGQIRATRMGRYWNLNPLDVAALGGWVNGRGTIDEPVAATTQAGPSKPSGERNHYGFTGRQTAKGG